MTQDEIIRMARECLIYPSTITDDNGTGMYATFEVYKASIEALQRFADLVAAHERDACAKVCEKSGSEPSSLWDETGCWIHASLDCAAAIRARGDNNA